MQFEDSSPVCRFGCFESAFQKRNETIFQGKIRLREAKADGQTACCQDVDELNNFTLLLNIFICEKGCKLGSLMRLKRESNEAGI